MRRLVCEYYDGFSFGNFVRNYPDLRGTVTDLLIGDLFTDRVDKVWGPMEIALPAGQEADSAVARRARARGAPATRRNELDAARGAAGPDGRVPSTARRVQFAETDLAGIVHFTLFFRYMEEAEHALWRAAGMSIARAGEPTGWPRLGAAFDFKAPLRFEDEFEVAVRIADVTRGRFSTSSRSRRTAR